jgi:hypothetical protein
VVSVPADGWVFRQLHVELLAIWKVDVLEVMETIKLAVPLPPFEKAFTVTEEGENTMACARAVAKEPRTPRVAKAAMELNLRKLFKLISTGDLPGRWRAPLQEQLASHGMPAVG